MRVLGMQVWPIRMWSPFWFILFIGMLVLWLTGCSDVTAPTIEMRSIPTQEQVVANLKRNGFNPTTSGGGVCQPSVNGTVAQVSICFADLWRALAIAGSAVGTCGAAISAASTGFSAWVAGSVCSIGLFASYDGFERYIERTQIGLWANQSAEEIANRMRQAIYERMVRSGRWEENAGCC